MKEAEWLQSMKNDDAGAFEQWMDVHAERMLLFAFQFGCTLEQAQELVEATFNEVVECLDQIENEEQLVHTFYKIVNEKLGNVQLTAPTSSGVLSFEEDEQLHQEIICMDNDWKRSLILSRFHGMTAVEVAMIMETSAEHVEQALANAYRHLDRVQLDKQLVFLQKSYQRIHLTRRKDPIYQSVPDPVQVATELLPKQQAIAKRPLYFWVIGVVVLIGLMVVSVVTSEDYQKKSREKYVERFQTSFEKEMAQKLDALGLVEEDLKDISHYYDIDGEYKGTVRDQFDSLITELEHQLEQGKKLNKPHIQKQYEQIVEQMELPSEMAQRLLDAPLTANREISLAFMERYMESVLLMQQAYFTKVLGYDELIGNSFSDKTFDVEKFYDQQATFPEDLQRALVGMEGQNLRLKSMEGWGVISPWYVKNNVSVQLRNSLHPDVRGYVTVLESQPFIHYQDEEDEYVASLAYSLEESVEFIVEMEKALLVTKPEGLLYQQSVMNYFSLLCEITACEQSNRVFDEEGQVKRDLRTAWRRLAENGKGSPAAVIMQQIIAEMEVTDWRSSESLSRLQSNHFFDALNLASEGKLQLFTIEEIEEIEWVD